MKRKSMLAIGLVLTATTILLLTFAAHRLAYLFSFDEGSGTPAVESIDDKSPKAGLREITLSWDATPHARYYNLYWSTRPKVTRITGNKISGVKPPVRFTQVEKGTTYYFVVTAVTDEGESQESEEIVYRSDP